MKNIIVILFLCLSSLAYAQWIPVHTFPAIVTKLYTIDTNIYAATDARVYRSSDNGMTWNTVNIPDTLIRDFYVDEKVMMIACPFLYVSYDQGASWIHDTASSSYLNVFSLTRAGNNLLCGTFGTFAGDSAKLYMSVDSGHSWTQQLVTDPYDGFPAFAVKDSFVVASSYAGQLYYSHDYGATYTSVYTPFAFEDAVITNSTIVVGAKTAGLESIRYSVNNGASWQMGLNANAATDFKCIGDTVFAATLKGFYYSVNGGMSWIENNAGLPVVTGVPSSMNTYAVGARGNDLWLTHRNGILYHLILSDLLSVGEQQPKLSSAIYPNPAHDHFFIRSNSPIDRFEIFSISGQKLMEGSNPKEIISIAGLAKGTYLVQIYVKDQVHISKLIVD